MKRIIARFLVLMLCINTIIYISPIKVLAADPVVTFPVDKSLVTAANQYQPANSTTQLDNQVFMEFSVAQLLQNMNLTYLYKDNTKVTLTVEPPNNDIIKVTYNLEIYSGGTWSNPIYDESRGEYLVYDPNKPGDGYVNPNTINIPTNSPFSIGKSGLGTPLMRTPTFFVKKGYGFSFKYNNHTMFFRWDNNTDNFYYVTNAFAKGNIYNVITQYGAGTPVDNYIFKGLDTNTFLCNPTANGDKIPADGVITGLNAGTRINTPIDTTTGLIHPADPDYVAGIELSFDLPKVAGATTFALPTAGSNIYDNLKSTIVLTERESIGNNSSITQISLEKLYNAIPTLTRLETPQLSKIVSNGATTTAAGRLTLKLKGVNPSVIFHKSTISLFSGDLKHSKTTDLEFGSVYTFPEYFFANDEFGNYSVYVKPYNYGGTYTLYSGADMNPPRNQIASQHAEVNTVQHVILPIDNTMENPRTLLYQIEFSPIVPPDAFSSNTKILSQFAKFIPSVPNVSTPQYFNITKTEMLPDFNATTPLEEGLVEMNIEWDIGSDKMITKLIDEASKLAAPADLIINYRLAYGLKPEITNTNDFKPLNANFDSDKAYDFLDLELHIKNTGTATAPVYKASYSIFKQDPNAGITLLAPVTDVTLTTREGIMPGTTRVMASSRLYFPAGKLGSSFTHLFKFPNIYYMNIRPFKCNVSTPTGLSKLRSFTLSDFDVQNIQPPQKFKLFDSAIENNIASFKSSWLISSSKLREFLETSSGIRFQRNATDPTIIVKPHENVNITMNLYISQVEDFITEDFIADYNKRLTNSVEVAIPANTKTTDTLILSGTGALAATGYTTARDALRDKKTIRIANIPLSSLETNLSTVEDILLEILKDNALDLPFEFKISGLDKNQRYYACVDIVADNISQKNGAPDIPDGFDKIHSSLSTVEGITTKTEPDIPTGEDKIPPAPVVEVVENSVTSISAAIAWDLIPTGNTNEVNEYQIIRLTDEQMPEKYTGKFEDVWAAITNSTKLGFETDVTIPNKLEIWDGTKFVALTTEQATKYLYNNSVTATRAQFTDKGLHPNTIYFYYVRTVRKTANNHYYSAWGQATVTTNPTLAPINLKVEYDADYDPKKEVVISFDAPVQYSDLGTKFKLQYRLKEDGQEWTGPIDMIVSRLANPTATPNRPGFFHYTYKITDGLLSGRAYSIQVRLLDLEMNDASMYSNLVVFRTEVDQEDYDDDQMRKDWLDYLRKELEKLLRDPYWVLTDTNREFEVLYRPTMFDALLNSTPDGRLQLVGSDADIAVYYIPATALQSANLQNKGFVVTHGNMEISISPNAIDTGTNTAIIEALKDINNRNEPAKDYYLKITLIWFNRADQIEFQTALSKQVDVRFEAICSTIDNKHFDNMVLNEIMADIEARLKDQDILEDIADEIKDGTINEELVRFILDLVGDIREDFLEIAADRLDDVLDNSYDIVQLKNPLLIAIKGLAAEVVAKGYQQKAGIWQFKELVNIGANKGFYTNEPGIFIFAGSQLIIPGINNVPGSATIVAIITKYGLDDFFGKGPAFNLDNLTSRYAAVASTARMMGAPRGSEPYAWLKTKGITVSARAQTEPISSEEAVYLVMQLYENKTNTKVATLQIRDFTITNSITGLDDKYKQHIRVALQTGIYTNRNMQAKSGITVRDFLQILAALDSKVKL